MRIGLLGLGIAVLVCACHGGPVESIVAADTQIRAKRYWVWIRGPEKQRERTFEVEERESDGALQGIVEVDGVWLWVDHESFFFERTPHTIRSCRCDMDTGEVSCRDGDFNTVYSLELRSKGTRRTLIQRPGDDPIAGMDSVIHTLEVIATLGPYAAVQESLYVDGQCAAHGSWSTLYSWFDLRNGKALDLVKAQPPPARVREPLEKRLCAARQQCQGDDEGGQEWGEDCRPEWVGVEPLWTDEQFVRRFVAALEAPYACSGDDAAYAITERFGAIPFEPPLSDFATVPAAVTRFVKAIPGASLGGVYEIPPEAPPLSAHR